MNPEMMVLPFQCGSDCEKKKIGQLTRYNGLTVVAGSFNYHQTSLAALASALMDLFKDMALFRLLWLLLMFCFLDRRASTKTGTDFYFKGTRLGTSAPRIDTYMRGWQLEEQSHICLRRLHGCQSHMSGRYPYIDNTSCLWQKPWKSSRHKPYHAIPKTLVMANGHLIYDMSTFL